MMDSVDRQVKRIIGSAVLHAYAGWATAEDEFANVCPNCEGDGCELCEHTGEQAA